jgi:polysaccharide biosynthesis/export protein
MRVDFRQTLAALALALPMAACSGSGSLPPISSNPNQLSTYTLGPGDQLSIKVVGADDLTGDYPVSDSGTVSVPLIGDVKASGLTRAELEREIASKLSQGYIRDPKVSVAIEKYRPFYIYGEVAKPGEYPYASGMKVLNAIATAGGFTYRANQNYVIVQRHGEKGSATGGTSIEPDDVIDVPERLF